MIKRDRVYSTAAKTVNYLLTKDATHLYLQYVKDDAKLLPTRVHVASRTTETIILGLKKDVKRRRLRHIQDPFNYLYR